jgi:hypothetical protein
MNEQNSPWTPELQNRVIALQSLGLSRSQIAAQVGMTKNQITGWLDRRAHPERTTYAWRVLAQRDCDYDGPTSQDRLQAYHDKMDAARWWPEFVNMERGTVVLRYPAPEHKSISRISFRGNQ